MNSKKALNLLKNSPLGFGNVYSDNHFYYNADGSIIEKVVNKSSTSTRQISEEEFLSKDFNFKQIKDWYFNDNLKLPILVQLQEGLSRDRIIEVIKIDKEKGALLTRDKEYKLLPYLESKPVNDQILESFKSNFHISEAKKLLSKSVLNSKILTISSALHELEKNELKLLNQNIYFTYISINNIEVFKKNKNKFKLIDSLNLDEFIIKYCKYCFNKVENWSSLDKKFHLFKEISTGKIIKMNTLSCGTAHTGYGEGYDFIDIIPLTDSEIEDLKRGF